MRSYALLGMTLAIALAGCASNKPAQTPPPQASAPEPVKAQEVSPQQTGRQHDLDVMPLMLRPTDLAPFPVRPKRDGGRQRQSPPGSGALDTRYIVSSLR